MITNKFFSSLLLIFLLTFSKSFAGVLSLEGFYQGKNLFIQNPVSGYEFCIVSVFLNGEKIDSSPKVSVLEVDLSKLTMNAPIALKILHHNNCVPKVLNEQVIKSKSKFEFTSLGVDKETINWSTKGDKIGSVFFVQQLSVSDEWENIGKTECKGNVSANYYSQSAEHCTGANKYRVKFVENDSMVFYSKIVSFQLDRKPISIYPKRVSDVLNFTTDKMTRYIIYTKEGVKIKEGKGVRVNCTDLKSNDHYIIVFDNQKKTFYKK